MRLDESDVLVAPGGVRWFPWVGTRCLRTLAILAQTNGVVCETDRLSLWLPLPRLSEFGKFMRRVVAAQSNPMELAAKVTPRAVEKFDEFLPDQLLDRACAYERLALDEAHRVIHDFLGDFVK